MEQLLDNAELLQRVKTELAVWDVNLNFQDLTVFNLRFDKVKFLDFNGSLKSL